MTIKKQKTHLSNTILYLLLVFSSSWGLDLILWETVGLKDNTIYLLFLQLRMLLPAFIAILLMRFFFKDSPIHRNHYQDKPVLFYYFFLGLVVVYAGLVFWGIVDPGQSALIGALSGGINMVVVMGLVTIRMISDGRSFSTAGLVGGRIRDWLLWGLGFIAFYGLATYLNHFFNLGQTINLVELMSQLQMPGEMSPQLFFLIILIQTVLVGALLSILFGFGEEYGWRGYLQSVLFRTGKIKGVILLGLIWGTWHFPLIWMGHNYPGHPFLGMVLMTGITCVLGFVLSHVMLKTGAIWLVAFLHALNNQLVTFLNSIVYQVSDPAYSFTYGVWGLLLALPVIFLLLRDPVWRRIESASLKNDTDIKG